MSKTRKSNVKSKTVKKNKLKPTQNKTIKKRIKRKNITNAKGKTILPRKILPKRESRHRKPVERYIPTFGSISKKLNSKQKKSIKQSTAIKNLEKLIDQDFFEQYRERMAIINLETFKLLNSKNIKVSYFRSIMNDFNYIIANKFNLLREGEHVEKLSYDSKLNNVEKFETDTHNICKKNYDSTSPLAKFCICCGKPITEKDTLDCDHVINLLDMLLLFDFGKVNIKNNFVFIHKICNNTKKNKTILEFIDMILHKKFKGPDYYDEGTRISEHDRIDLINEKILKPLNNNFIRLDKSLHRHKLLLDATLAMENAKKNLSDGLDKLEEIDKTRAAVTLLEFEKSIRQ